MPPAASYMPSLAGSIIDGRYRLIRIVGSGSFGVVYRAIDLRAPIGECDRAIKFVSKAGRKESSIATLRREMALHKRVSHLPNVITLHHAYESADYFAFIMDYCNGGDLGSYLSECGQLTDTDEVKKIILTLLDAVASLHAEGIYHRDIKPHNILINKDRSRVYLADFGLSTDIREYAHICGTMPYMPPECILVDPLRKPDAKKADMWALGLILLNMISGGVPWHRASRTSDTYLEFVDDPNYLLKCVPLSVGANSIIRRMLRANPLIRANPEDVSAMILELDSFWRPYDEPAPSEWETLPKMRSTIASEFNIHDSQLSWAPNTEPHQAAAMNRSAGSVATSATRCSSGRSSLRETLVVSPTGSVMMVKDMCEKKDMGERVKSLVHRVTKRFAMGS